MMSRFNSYVLAFGLLGCAASSSVDGPEDMPDAIDMDALTPDAGNDVGNPDVDPPPAFCEPHVFFGCSSAVARWVWTGSDCETLVECPDLGSATRNACLEAHVACGAVPSDECLPIACPEECPVACDADGGNSYCDCSEEGSFVLIDQERDCSDDGGPAWIFTLAPRAETFSIGRDYGVLRDDLSEASETIQIRLSANRDPFHDPERVLFGAEGLEIERCRTFMSPCAVPTAGSIEVETGGAGEMRIDIQLSFAGTDLFAAGDIRVAPNWFSLNYTDNGC